MNTQASLSGARRRVMLIVLAGGVPLALALGLLMMRMAGFDAGSVALTFALLIVAGFATWRARRLGPRWLVAQLNEHPRFEDSADLLFAMPETLNPLQQRQHARIEQRLRESPPDLRPRWPWPRLLACIVPDEGGRGTVVWPIFVASGRGLKAKAEVRAAAWLFTAFLMPDVEALRGMRFQPPRPSNADAAFLAYLAYLRALPQWAGRP